MTELPMFSVDTPRRCFGSDRNSTSSVCGRRACWMLQSPNGAASQFFCDLHRLQGVVPIAPDAPFRRISLTVEVLISAGALTAGEAHQEAVATVLDAVASAGAVPNLVAITSAVGRYTPWPASGPPPRVQGRR